MRKSFYALIASFILLAQFSCGPTHAIVESPPPPPPQAEPAPDVTYQSFYDALSPYGEWINDPEYGYVWMPNTGPDFKPYSTNGNWVYTDEGWTWASGYPWGWAAFHYGRWFYEEGYGWMWMPGNEWAPAWVSWRQSPEYFGWAPLGPSVSINASFGGGYNPPAHYWCFVPQRYVTNPHVTNYYVNEQQNVTIINNTTIINNSTVVNNRGNNPHPNNYAGGPDPVEVSRITGAQLRPVAIRGSNTPGENRSGSGFAIYRPRINAAPVNGGMSPRPAPTRVQPITNVRPVNPTVYTNGGRYNNNGNRPGNIVGNNNPGNNNSGNNNNPPSNNAPNNGNNYNNTRSTVQPYSSAQPGNLPPGQTPAQPGRQAGLQPMIRTGNASGYSGNGNVNNLPKPAANPNPGRPTGPRNNSNTRNGNGRPGQPNGRTNPPKPKPNQAQGAQGDPHKPDQNNPANHP